MDKLELLHETKKLVGEKDITTLIKESKILFKYLNTGYDIISRIAELKIFNNFATEFSVMWPTSGLNPVTCRPFYDEIVSALDNNNVVSVSCKRQQGLTTFACLYALYYASINPYKTIVYGCVNKMQAEDVSEYISDLYSSVTENIMPTISKWNKNLKQFDNGSKILLRTITPNMVRGLSTDLFILDSASCVSYSYVDDIFAGLWPTMATGGKMLSFSYCPDIENEKDLFVTIKNKSQKFIDLT